jgi:hypothetical protein
MIGYRYFKFNNAFWRENQNGLLPLSPPKQFCSFSNKEALSLINKENGYFLRWETNFDQLNDSSWWHIIKDSGDTLETLPKKTRYMIRKASCKYYALPVDRDQIIGNGYQVYIEAFKRYNTHEPIYTQKEFYNAIIELPENTEFWGVYEKDSKKLVAFSENYIESNVCFYVTMWSTPKAMSEFAGYLLFHQMEIYYLLDRNFSYISDGARSLSHDTNIHEFLIKKFRFRKAFANLNVNYSSWFGLIVKCVFPFRKVISKIPLRIFQKAFILLKQEEINRSCSMELG